MDSIKNKYKKAVKEMNRQEILNEHNELNISRMKIKIIVSQGLNPNKNKQTIGFPVRSINWKFAIISQELDNRSKR